MQESLGSDAPVFRERTSRCRRGPAELQPYSMSNPRLDLPGTTGHSLSTDESQMVTPEGRTDPALTIPLKTELG